MREVTQLAQNTKDNQTKLNEKQEQIKKLISKGKKTGILTYKEVMDTLEEIGRASCRERV